MRKFLFLIVLLFTFKAKAQIGYEDFYSVNELESNLKRAKTVLEQMDAAGCLAVRYKYIRNDSLKNLYLKKVFALAQNGNDIKLMGRALWWDLYFESSVYDDWDYKASDEKAGKLFKYAEQHNLLKEKISCNLLIADIKIHKDILAAEKYSQAAQGLLNEWKKDTTGKDSLRLEVYQRLAHVYIHRRKGIETVTFVQLLQDYARQDKNELLNIKASVMLAEMYFEWGGQREKALPLYEKAYDYYKKTKQPYRFLFVVFYLSSLHHQLENNDKAIAYLKELDKLADSLNAYGFYQKYLLWNRLGVGVITNAEFIQTLDNNFNGHLFLPKKIIASDKASIYLRTNPDSAKHYLLLAKKLGEDNTNLWLSYYSSKKDYHNLVPLLKQSIKSAGEEGDLQREFAHTNWLSATFRNQKEYKLAYEYLRKGLYIKDSLDRLKNNDKVVEMEMQRQMEIQKAAYDEQKRTQEAEKDKIALRNKIRTLGLLGGVAVLLLVAGLLWRNNQRKQRDKQRVEQAYQELKSTQQQLIQSEKMASLGELTAGIAHEIQNPLNFVNNFSDVNTELIDELEQEVNKGNLDEVKAIAKDIKENEQKINHHGKRADTIVKGMLQHSRTSSGQKESTDINVLADEYLRLAYHGLKAKDRSFNATMKTDFDKSIGNINIIPQDIGRVILNLINNAFYAVDEKKKQIGNGYEPTVSVRTKKNNGKVEIKVKDNGNGVPQKVLDKIFQPFFTTKPTGQGTGLGLSLAYDIVTKGHGGELKVETKEGEGSEFIIQIPAN